MKTLLSIGLALLLSGCLGDALIRRGSLVGVYEAEHAIDTIEHLSLSADGRFLYEYSAIFGEGAGYEGRWEFRGKHVVLVTSDHDGARVEFPLYVSLVPPAPKLVYTDESYETAKAKMLLPDSYRLTSKTPNDAPVPTPPFVTAPAEQEPRQP